MNHGQWGHAAGGGGRRRTPRQERAGAVTIASSLAGLSSLLIIDGVITSLTLIGQLSLIVNSGFKSYLYFNRTSICFLPSNLW